MKSKKFVKKVRNLLGRKLEGLSPFDLSKGALLELIDTNLGPVFPKDCRSCIPEWRETSGKSTITESTARSMARDIAQSATVTTVLKDLSNQLLTCKILPVGFAITPAQEPKEAPEADRLAHEGMVSRVARYLFKEGVSEKRFFRVTRRGHFVGTIGLFIGDNLSKIVWAIISPPNRFFYPKSAARYCYESPDIVASAAILKECISDYWRVRGLIDSKIKFRDRNVENGHKLACTIWDETDLSVIRSV